MTHIMVLRGLLYASISLSVLTVNDLTESLPHALDAAGDEGVTHAEVLEAVAHASVSPMFREALDLIGLVRRQET